MTVEVQGFDDRDKNITGEVSLIASMFCIAEGIPDRQAFIIGGAGADYAGRVILVTLREMGIIPVEGIDQESFIKTANDVSRRSDVQQYPRA